METVLIVATILGGLSAIWFFWDKLTSWLIVGSRANQHDIELYKQYRDLFVDTGVAEFYRQHDFLGSFRESYWSPLSQYVDSWNTVDHEFIDKRLNKMHKKVYEAALKLGSDIAKNTVTIGKGSYVRSVKPDYLPPGPTPEHIKGEAREINDLVPNFVNAHLKFVRLANQRLPRGNA